MSRSSAKRDTLPTYPKRMIEVNGKFLGMLFRTKKGCAGLVTLYNICTLTISQNFGVDRPLTEFEVKELLSGLIKERIDRKLHDVPGDVLTDVLHVLDSFRNIFSLEPCMCTHTDFKNNASFKLCHFLGFKLYHVWILDPEVRDYEKLKDFSYAELVEYSRRLGDKDKQLKICRSLLDDGKNQLTTYGYRTLSAELQEDTIDLLFCRNRLDIIHKHKDVLYVLVTEDDIRKKMPDAYWILFEELEGNTEYFTEQYGPVKGQPYEERALELHRKFLDEMGRKAAARYAKKQIKKLKKMRAQGGPSDDAGVQSSETAASEALDDGSCSRGQDDSGSSQKEGKRSEDPIGGSSQVGGGAETTVGEGLGFIGCSPQDETRAEIVVSEGLDCVGSPPKEENIKQPVGGGHNEGVETSLHQEFGNEPKGVASSFLKFLLNFKDDGCSEPYFKGNLASFTSQAPNFYVPYPFIVAHDEVLALTIQDSYSRICEDLRTSVIHYLAMNEVSCPDVVLKLIGLPKANSAQSFLDFLATIDLHEHYDLLDGDVAALPSFDSRRMASGYIEAIVAKFRTGRSWAGKWSEQHMKVHNNSDFVIDCRQDCELTADAAFFDLTNFGSIVLERLKFNGQMPPYLDEWGTDIMLINDCFGDAVKWERFLQLISYPMGLKPPLVRAAFLCNIYVIATGNTSGDPPRYRPFHSRKDCSNWKEKALKDELLRKVYDFQNSVKRKKIKHILDSWSNSHWHLFMFCRHFLQHAHEHIKDKAMMLKIEDISIVEVLLSRTLNKAIGKSIRFLVLNCGVDTIFSSSWRHYAGSDYADKQAKDLECTTASDIFQEFVYNISTDKKYVCSEVSAYLEQQHISIIESYADLIQIQSYLKENGFEFQDAGGGHLRCGSISLYTRHHPSTEHNPDHTSIVVEGTYSMEYTSVFLLLTEFLCS